MSVDFIIVLINMLYLYLMILINIVKKDLSSFQYVENLMISLPWLMAQEKMVPSVFCGLFYFFEENVKIFLLYLLFQQSF